MKLSACANRGAARRGACSRSILAFYFASLTWIVAPFAARADGVSSAVYVRTDSDDTLVVSPRAHARAHLGEPTQVDLTYAADIWTSASIDIRASASRAVTEQRNELDAAIAHNLGDLTLTASYRYSVENDYVSHGATLGGTLNVADNSASFALNAFGFRDAVGRAGSPSFSRDLTTLGARASLTQIFDPSMFGQLTYELGYLEGYQASPYRFVGFGPNATGFGCVGALQCVREDVPDSRLRHAMAALVRRALSEVISVGAEYRFYLDDWEQTSHTVAVQFGWAFNQTTLLTLRYRFYTQRGVWFYSRVYRGLPDLGAFATRDREQSPMHDHRIGLEFEDRIGLGSKDANLLVSLQTAGTFYAYDDFAGLKNVSALEITLALAIEN